MMLYKLFSRPVLIESELPEFMRWCITVLNSNEEDNIFLVFLFCFGQRELS